MEHVKLKDIATLITKGTTPTSLGFDFEKEGINFVKIESITEDGNFIENKFAHISNECNEKLNRSKLQENDILFSIAGAIGRVAVVNKEILPANTNQALAIIRIPEGMYEYRFLEYVLKSNYVAKQFEKKKQGVAQLNLSLQDIGELLIPRVELEKQKYIVEVFEKLEKNISCRKLQLEKLDELVKARFVELFGDVSDFVNITDIAHTYIGLVTTMTKHYCNNGTPLLFNSSIKSDKIVWDGTYLDAEFAEANKSRMHKTNDIVTVHTGDIGTSAVVGEEFNNSLGFATIVTRINDVSRYYPRFVSSFLNYGSGKEQLKKYSRDVRNNLNLKDFNRLMVPNVSALEQKRYVDFLEQTDKSKLVVQKSLEKLEVLKKALMQKYFE